MRIKHPAIAVGRADATDEIAHRDPVESLHGFRIGPARIEDRVGIEAARTRYRLSVDETVTPRSS